MDYCNAPFAIAVNQQSRPPRCLCFPSQKLTMNRHNNKLTIQIG